MNRYELLHGDCLEKLKELPDNSVDAVVCDPPYDLTGGSGSGGFMGKKWDATGIAFRPDVWIECLRVLKPGGHLLAFGGTRTYHRMACAIEDAGFDIKDSIHWVYSTGFPKSHNISKALDKMAGAEREVVGFGTNGMGRLNKANADAGYRPNAYSDGIDGVPITAPATDLARQWDGYGTALKPAHEPIVVARKNLDGTIAANVIKWGVGGINVDRCRVSYASADDMDAARVPQPNRKTARKQCTGFDATERNGDIFDPSKGRWPSNLLFSHLPECRQVGTKRVKGSAPASGPTLTGESISNSRGRFNGVAATPSYADPDGMETVEAWECAESCAVKELDRQSGTSKSNAHNRGVGLNDSDVYGKGRDDWGGVRGHADSGGASRFFPTFHSSPEDQWECADGCAVKELDRQSGKTKSHDAYVRSVRAEGEWLHAAREAGTIQYGYGDSGGASRFFPVFRYQSKASRRERDAGLDDFATKDAPAAMNTRCESCNRLKLNHPESRCTCNNHVPAEQVSRKGVKNTHTTVKPVALMKWLVRLVTPPNGVVLDPFTGSGTTGVACMEEGFRFIGCEREDEYIAIARARIEHAANAGKGKQLSLIDDE